MPRRAVRPLAVLVVVALGLVGPSLRGGDSSAAPPVSLRVVASEFAFAPATIEIPADTPVTITLVNVGLADHTLAVPDLDVATGVVHGKGETTLTLTAPAGDYPFLCGVPGHALLGMTGVLHVVAPSGHGTPVPASPVAGMPTDATPAAASPSA